ncbi:hypothetical protein FRX31_009084 [Thalictrum thalictroides]|uniref:Reverse transcriptase zinc-binding domain-containing protein n=1 Tax=Thalictrum thalictroides TaxID=46969 RepID=A0A7J6WVB3_THATH|nr:hypothetical protein FRX31_009084 [Thalictrum thalictroides]
MEMATVEGDGIIWNFHFRRNLFDWEQSDLDNLMAILQRVVFYDGDDTWKWRWSRSCRFTVRSMYKELFARSRDETREIQVFPVEVTWEKAIPPKVKMFIWTTILGRILTLDNLA